MIWFSMILVVAIAIAMFMIVNQTRTSISFSDFQRLISATKYAQGSSELVEGSAGIEVQEQGEHGRRIRFSSPTRLEVGQSRITGRVRMKILDGKGSENEEKTVEFVVNKGETDTLNAELKNLLDASNVHWYFSDGPNFWDRYGFLFITMGLIVLLFFFHDAAAGWSGRSDAIRSQSGSPVCRGRFGNLVRRCGRH